jgi:NADH-quinone oxidoreductase subunit J
MDWIGQHWLIWVSLLLIAAGIWWLMPRAVARPKAIGLILTLAGIALLATRVEDMRSPIEETALFWLFAAGAVLSAVLMITHRNPVYSALWFAVVTLCVCGLFLLQSAPFLAAATVVIYAGAIVVTFVFVIMLAQQGGATAYDQRARQPFVATMASFALLAMIVGTLHFTRENAIAANGGELAAAAETNLSEAASLSAGTDSSADLEGVANPLSQLRKEQPMGRVRALGRSLFGDYLFAVEMAGTLLLIATIGAIAIAPRRQRGTL